VIDLAIALKKERKEGRLEPLLTGKHVALIFEKPSLRTRVSFTVAIQELNGMVVENTSATSKKEEPEDVMRVLNGYVHGVMLRTHEHSNLDRMVPHAQIPIINGLSDAHHPCQVLADLQTLKEVFGAFKSNGKGLKVTYMGDGNNMLHSLLLLLPFLGIDFRYACPKGYQPNALILRRAKLRAKEGGGSVTAFATPAEAVKDANAIYTDVWTSMGFEEEKKERERAFAGYQINDELYARAAKGAVIMHCLPMERGKELSASMADHKNAVLFQQSENRLHAQKALLVGLMS
jgi:ornithine carbamoyltransferase